MTPQDREPFAKALAALGEVYDKLISEALAELLWEDLADYELPVVLEAMRRHRRDPDQGRFFPKPSDLLRWLVGTTMDRSLLAWSAVLQAIRDYGAYNSLDFGDSITHAVIEDMGGWPQICAVLTEELPFREKDFRDRYRVFSARQMGVDGHMSGLHEQANIGQFPEWVPAPISAGSATRKPRRAIAPPADLPVGVTADTMGVGP